MLLFYGMIKEVSGPAFIFQQFLPPGFSGLLGSLKYLFRFEVKVVWKKFKF
ncbi:hypothetical protein SAMN06296241_2404 [Salinimicrobium sediminis]|uniref:Uncharacterized protein n=1 Tax=Salinimicrobium sediminis TaxID=1343891 RepID=A0A285X674_9FLAO|nr:hypothetical protein SAMN06296241_2404 [Salinimicrobium sediminis]